MTGRDGPPRALAEALRAATGHRLLDASGVGGGSIAAAARLRTDRGDVFVKSTGAAQADWFEAEADGLAALAQCGALRVPRVLGHAADATRAYLFLEWLDLRPARGSAHARMGEALAALHERRGERFGWHRDNYLGATAQENGWQDDWVAFFERRRLRPQLELAERNGYGGALQREGARVLARLESLIGDAPVQPCLIHGDLWGGNWGADEAGRPAVFDPAVHYADPACDLAMTRLFGGFAAGFYAAYEARHGAPDAGRIALYQLYHVLNHVNLFGGGYVARAVALMRALA